MFRCEVYLVLLSVAANVLTLVTGDVLVEADCGRMHKQHDNALLGYAD